MPEYFIAMEAFPLTASGKILKRELVEWTKSGAHASLPRAGALDRDPQTE